MTIPEIGGREGLQVLQLRLFTLHNLEDLVHLY